MRSPLDALLSPRTLTVPLLAVVGGSVDAIVRLGLGVLVAAQTGNTILLAASIAQRRFSDALQNTVSLVGYVTGTAVGAAIAARTANASRRAVRIILGVELVVLITLAVAWWTMGGALTNGQRSALIALAAIAMGLQSAAVLTMHVRPATTYVTGTLTAFTTELVERETTDAAHAIPGAQSPPKGSGKHVAGTHRPGLFMMDQPWVYGAAWFIYAIGALVGALFFQWGHSAALLLPLAAITVALILEATERDSVSNTSKEV